MAALVPLPRHDALASAPTSCPLAQYEYFPRLPRYWWQLYPARSATLPSQAFAVRVPNLRTLSLANSAATDAAVRQLSASFPELCTLDLSNCEALTNGALQVIGRKLPRLQHLCLQGCRDGALECSILVYNPIFLLTHPPMRARVASFCSPPPRCPTLLSIKSCCTLNYPPPSCPNYLDSHQHLALATSADKPVDTYVT
jgi:hypothetical protein